MVTVVLQSGWIPGETELVRAAFVVAVVGLFVAVPTVGMYRESSAQGNRPGTWTWRMFVLSILFPAVGPIALWILYTTVAPRE